ncbi:hypothetical protein MtrunA17_Chr1g0171881 [Medicago truncatula]|uniref:Hop-interacting protein THI031, putative n=1 Tax=Medicago truncatula TaxID=3880 RepID=A0A072VI44_MEDTR|nr:uncharacterized protein LOC25483297 [Medicago truncatula]KEH41462.1 Hop-interacting protein THI031, putative [Medicago truncatula]RHN78985.1 hypothetical protein MtrunA17_Chr1g0171881 [Medicago truncatula]
MKREGKQHGMVRTYRILPNPTPGTRFITRFDSPPTAGLFTKVPSKPTNHSKFTGKCGTPQCFGCRLHPVSKSKNKSKGNHKHFRVMDQPNSNLIGLSATETLNNLSDFYMDDDDDDEVENVSVDNDYYVNHSSTIDETVGFRLIIEQVKEEKYEDDWCLVECCS